MAKIEFILPYKKTDDLEVHDPVLPDNVLRVKRVAGAKEEYYTLVTSNGKYYVIRTYSPEGEQLTYLRSKSLEGLGMKVGEMRAKSKMKDGLDISERDGFSKKDISLFWRGYYEVYSPILLSGNMEFAAEEAKGRKNSGPKKGVYGRHLDGHAKNDNTARL